jgi:hypothetical protein
MQEERGGIDMNRFLIGMYGKINSPSKNMLSDGLF